MKLKYILIIILLSISISRLISQEGVNSYSSVPSKESQQSKEVSVDDFKKTIAEYYKPPACFLLIFRTDITVPGYGKQSANGNVRADNKKNRIRILLTEANLGLTISWITILNNIAYLSNPRQEKVMKVPVESLELGSFTNNSIKFPFSLFQDILFGRLPNGLLESSNWIYQEQYIGKYIESNGDLISFYFDKQDPRRIEKIEYKKTTIDYTAIANFMGKFYDTKYPEKLKIQTFQNNKPLESMDLYFYRYIDNAWCYDQYFPIK